MVCQLALICEMITFLAFKPVVKLKHEDDQSITPMLDPALARGKQPKVQVFIDGIKLEDWELSAAWDELKLGLKHAIEYEK